MRHGKPMIFQDAFGWWVFQTRIVRFSFKTFDLALNEFQRYIEPEAQ